jgi:hypothetical protein
MVKSVLGLALMLALSYGLVAGAWGIGQDVGRKAQLAHDRQCVADASAAQDWAVWRAMRDCVGEGE